MRDEARRPVTEEQRERLHVARALGDRCGLCGRTLDAAEAVYFEQFVVSMRRPAGRSAFLSPVYMRAPVGVECTSPEFRMETEGREPEPCARCGRPVYYQTARSNRLRALCSRRCGSRAGAATRAAVTGEDPTSE